MTPGEPIERHEKLRRLRAPSAIRAAKMIEVNMKYARCFLDGDFEGMEEFLVEEPVFEHYPQAMRIAGREAVRARSKRGFSVTAQFDSRDGGLRTHRITAVCFANDALVHEFSDVLTMPDGSRRRDHRKHMTTLGRTVREPKLVTELMDDHILPERDNPEFVSIFALTGIELLDHSLETTLRPSTHCLAPGDPNPSGILLERWGLDQILLHALEVTIEETLRVTQVDLDHFCRPLLRR